MRMMARVTLCSCDHEATDTDWHTLTPHLCTLTLYTFLIPNDLWLVDAGSGAERGRVQGHRPISGPRTKNQEAAALGPASGAQGHEPYDSS